VTFSSTDYTFQSLGVEVAGQRSMTLLYGNTDFQTDTTGSNSNDVGGILHGTWTANTGDSTWTSDLRLKTQIAPLFDVVMGKYEALHGAGGMFRDPQGRDKLRSLRPVETETSAPTPSVSVVGSEVSQQTKDEAVLALMRQLSPVSYKYKNNSESKYSRFGFVAQDIEKMLPDVVRQHYTGDSDLPTARAMMYRDLISVLTMGMQSMDRVSENLEIEIQNLSLRADQDYEELDPKLKLLEDLVVKHIVDKFDVDSLLDVAGDNVEDSVRAAVLEEESEILEEALHVLAEEAVYEDSSLVNGDEEVSGHETHDEEAFEREVEIMLQKLNSTAEGILRGDEIEKLLEEV
jgi:hypothetical protein